MPYSHYSLVERSDSVIPMAVTRCLCLNLTFVELHDLAQREGLDFNGLRDRSRCCTGCGMCEPYVRVMLNTGKTSFQVFRSGEAARILREARAAARKAGAAAETQPLQSS